MYVYTCAIISFLSYHSYPSSSQMIVALRHKHGELSPEDIEQRLMPVGRFMYRHFLKPDESNYPKIQPDLTFKVRVAYGTSYVWCALTSIYVFL